jgi:hypothetical protein
MRSGAVSPGTCVSENDPAFTFIPVNDDTSAQLLLKPVPAADDCTTCIFRAGGLDQLFRLLVDRIEVSTSELWRHGLRQSRHSTTRLRGCNPSRGARMRAILADASAYATFLRVSAVVYGLQKHGSPAVEGHVRRLLPTMH